LLDVHVTVVPLVVKVPLWAYAGSASLLSAPAGVCVLELPLGLPLAPDEALPPLEACARLEATRAGECHAVLLWVEFACGVGAGGAERWVRTGPAVLGGGCGGAGVTAAEGAADEAPAHCKQGVRFLTEQDGSPSHGGGSGCACGVATVVFFTQAAPWFRCCTFPLTPAPAPAPAYAHRCPLPAARCNDAGARLSEGGRGGGGGGGGGAAARMESVPLRAGDALQLRVQVPPRGRALWLFARCHLLQLAPL
jgi:hypothetical protein